MKNGQTSNLVAVAYMQYLFTQVRESWPMYLLFSYGIICVVVGVVTMFFKTLVKKEKSLILFKTIYRFKMNG